MEHNDDGTKPRKVKVTDRRKVGGSQPQQGETMPPLAEDGADAAAAPPTETVPLDDYLRLQADFDNRRKRLMRETASASDRAKREMLERLLPLLDNFDRALEHNEDASSLELLHDQLFRTLQSEGLEEIAAEGQPFDPHVHDAIESHPSTEVEDTVVKTVYRKGYRLGDRVLRAATVVVSHPVEDHGPNEQADDARAEG
ncbi:MAG: nucleotide exchange factor GrpE [Actinomycetota bacterium]